VLVRVVGAVLARGRTCGIAATAWTRRPAAARLRGEWREEEGVDDGRQRGLAGGAVGGRGGQVAVAGGASGGGERRRRDRRGEGDEELVGAVQKGREGVGRTEWGDACVCGMVQQEGVGEVKWHADRTVGAVKRRGDRMDKNCGRRGRKRWRFGIQL
jgi:hypothetical protein